jgi:hypothetical protein
MRLEAHSSMPPTPTAMGQSFIITLSIKNNIGPNIEPSGFHEQQNNQLTNYHLTLFYIHICTTS